MSKVEALKLTYREASTYKAIINLFIILHQEGFHVEKEFDITNWIKKDIDVYFNMDKQYVEISKWEKKSDKEVFSHKISLLTSEESFEQLLKHLTK